MTAFRWTRAEMAKRGEQLGAARQVEDPDYETMGQYWARMRVQRETRARVAAQNLQALPRPLKPPARRDAT